MPTTTTVDHPANSVWLKKRLAVWKTKSSDSAGQMRHKSAEKIVTKAVGKAKYRHPEIAKTDVLSVVRVYKGLSPELDKFVFDDGNEKSLINVNGTIPVEYKGATYNIPVCLWLLQEYPAKPPMGYVTPTKDMQLKVSNHVDHTGKILLPYISEWKYPDSTLLGLVQTCRNAFGELPPVFSKIKPSTSASSSSEAGGAGRSQSAEATPAAEHRRSFAYTSSLSEDHESNNDPSGGDVVTEEHLRVSLVTHTEGLMKETFKEEFLKTKAELQSLHSTNKELLDGQEEIGAIESELDCKLAEVDGYNEDLQHELEALEKAVGDLDRLDPNALDVDEGVLTVQDPVHAQLVRAFAEDAALDDAIYHLGEALRLGQIDSCEVYLKKVRNLSRKQFFLRATMSKCRAKAQLDDIPDSKET